eukprot:1161966-Pelagomonas_calceolata.AAC.12
MAMARGIRGIAASTFNCSALCTQQASSALPQLAWYSAAGSTQPNSIQDQNPHSCSAPLPIPIMRSTPHTLACPSYPASLHISRGFAAEAGSSGSGNGGDQEGGPPKEVHMSLQEALTKLGCAVGEDCASAFEHAGSDGLFKKSRYVWIFVSCATNTHTHSTHKGPTMINHDQSMDVQVRLVRGREWCTPELLALTQAQVSLCCFVSCSCPDDEEACHAHSPNAFLNMVSILKGMAMRAHPAFFLPFSLLPSVSAVVDISVSTLSWCTRACQPVHQNFLVVSAALPVIP